MRYSLDYVPRPEKGGRDRANLESTADTEDTVVGFLSGKTLDGLLDGLALLGDQVVEPM